MKRVKLIVAYDGTNYCGWQYQPNGITIEEVLNESLTRLFKEPVAVQGASRTDSGVHAKGNVAIFDTDNRMPADKVCIALNQRLPDDIRILHSEEVPLTWHPRKHNCIKTYEYKIMNRKISIPTERLYSCFCYVPLDVDQMREGAAYLVGEHDFKSFCTPRTKIEETVRTIYSLTIDKSGDMITLRISGSGFLYNMVRIIAGTLMKVGTGAYEPAHVARILDARDRMAAGPKAGASGLTLVNLEYEKELVPYLEGQNQYWSYTLDQTRTLEDQVSHLVIHHCAEEDYNRLMLRMIHQAFRNGGRTVILTDEENTGRLTEHRRFGYYEVIWLDEYSSLAAIDAGRSDG